MSQPFSHAARLIQIVERTGARQAFTLVSKNHIVRVTRSTKPRKGDRATSFVVTYGKPNYAERQIIKGRVAIGAPFPATKVRRYKR